MTKRVPAYRCSLHEVHEGNVIGRCPGENMRKITKRSRIKPGVSYIVSPMGDVFRVVDFDRAMNRIKLAPVDLMDSEREDEFPVMANNRFTALVAAGYEYTNNAKEKVKLLSKED